VDWDKLENGIHGTAAREAAYTPKLHQEKAIAKAHDYFQHANRGKLIMACGTGKTFTSLRFRSGSKTNVLYYSLSHLLRSLGRFYENGRTAAEPLNAICVCSDPKISQSTRKKT
jgi:predicted helicase